LRQSTKTTLTTRGFSAFYRAALPLSSKTLNYAARIVRRHRASIGSLWRKLNPGSRRSSSWSTCVKARRSPRWRPVRCRDGHGLEYVNETVALLAARAPKLRKAVRDAKKTGPPTWSWTAP